MSTIQRRNPIRPEAGSTDRSIIRPLREMRYLFAKAHFPHIFLLLAALFLTGSRSIAQSNAADQGFKTIPQQIKTNAEVKATNRANSIASDVGDKIDSGMSKAYRGFVHMFGKKKKGAAVVPGRDSTTVAVKDSTTVAVRDTTGVPVRNSGGMPVKDSTGVAATRRGKS